jgi:cytochrome c
MNRIIRVVAVGSTLLVPLSAAALSDSEATALLGKYNCKACHADTKIVGPGYKEIAKKYAGDASAPAKLAEKIKSGGSGTWGAIPMPPNNLPEADLKNIVDWILHRS